MKNIWITGFHAVDAVLRLRPERAIELHVVVNPKNKRQQKIIDLALNMGVAFHPVDKSTLSKQTDTKQHQGVALYAKAMPEKGEKELLSTIKKLMARDTPPLILVLDQVKDPHNLGACLRTADAAGVDAVIVSKDNSSPITQVVRKVASGAVESLPVFRVTNLARSLEQIKEQGIWVTGTSDKAEQSIYQQDLKGALAIVMGAEGEGLRNLTEKMCDNLVSLPMAGSVVSSLNVSVATGVCLYEAVRQRQGLI